MPRPQKATLMEIRSFRGDRRSDEVEGGLKPDMTVVITGNFGPRAAHTGRDADSSTSQEGARSDLPLSLGRSQPR